MDVQSANEVRGLLSAFLEKGFRMNYFHEKGGDSSCVYIYRFQKGKDFFDWRETSDDNEMHFVVYADGQYCFPNLTKRQAKRFRSFRIKHLFRKATQSEKRELFASAILAEWQASPDNFFGIQL